MISSGSGGDDALIEPKILAVDSASLTGSIALCSGETLVAESLLNVRSTHSERLLQQVDLLLAESGWSLAELDLLAVTTGPGSFTGLRIGIATVKGLAQVLAKPVVGISSLQMVALNAPAAAVPICAFLDARKKEVYTQLFEATPGGPCPLGEAKVLPPADLLASLTQKVLLLGDGVVHYRQLIETMAGANILLPWGTAHQLRASQAAWLAYRRWLNQDLSMAAELLPTYIRPSDAELSKMRKT